MTEPTRLRDDGPDAVRALLRQAPPTRSMSREERDRSRGRVARAAAGLAAGAGTLAILQGAAIGAGVGLLTVGAAQIVPAWVSPPPSAPLAPAPLHPVAPLASAVRPPPEPPSASPSTTADPPAPRPSVHPPASASEAPSAAPPGDTLAEEAALLEQARAALATSPAQALALTEAHAARFPGGKLGMERELLAIDALRRLGRGPEARARAEALLSRARGGLYEDRLRKLLDGLR